MHACAPSFDRGAKCYKINSLSKLWFTGLVFLIFSIILGVLWCMGGSSSHDMAAFTLKATAKQTASVIFLHGLGDTGNGWCAGFEDLKQPHIKYIFPNAPINRVTLNGGMQMPSWFDIYSLNAGGKEDVEGIKSAAKNLQSLISAEESNGIARNRIVIGGFSQGGAVALYSALAYDKPSLAGVLALSTWLPLHQTFPEGWVANKNTPVLQCHGKADPVVNIQLGQMTHTLLNAVNPNHQFKSYQSMGHSSCPEEMVDVRKFLDEVLPPI